MTILEHSTDAIVQRIIVPASNRVIQNDMNSGRSYNINIFRNASGVLR